ncbi:MAG: protein-tyrosine phosphatase-like protein [Benniella sp.]|nr:MAG: protein-tyrosine phosphatase-like protein [Benniella sp.]
MSEEPTLKSNRGPTIGTLTTIRIKAQDAPLYLTGVLQSTNHASRRLGIICHGVLGHKNYLFQPMLANMLAPFMDTFRFDFRGNGDSEGQVGYSNWADDLNDIDSVVKHFEQQGYQIYALIGHSRGAISSLNYAASYNHVPLIPYIISLSTRFDMSDAKRRHGKQVMQLLEDQGYFDWEGRSAGKDVSLRVTKKNFDDFIEFDTASVVNIPAMTNILLCHGSEDAVVPIKDIGTLHRHLSHARTTLRIITNADHNYRGHYEEISQTVARYFSEEGRKEEWSRRVMPNWRTWVNSVGGVLNFRTVGDIWIPSGTDDTLRYMRPGIIYRCADISSPTPEGIRVLESLNITDVFDLRSTLEAERRPTFETAKIKRHHVPVFAEEDYSPAKIAARFSMYLGGVEGFTEAYMTMLPNVSRFLPPILDHIVNKKTPFVVHCTGGKDRTGIVCAILQMICGVDDAQIAWEYELTHCCQAIKEEDVQFVKAAMGDDATDERVRGLLSAKAEYMSSFLERFHREHGTVQAFLTKELGMTLDQIHAVRDALSVEIPVPRAVL